MGERVTTTMPTMTQSPSVCVSVLYDSYVNDSAQQPAGLAELRSPESAHDLPVC